MGINDIIIAITFGFAAAMWVCIYFLLIVKLFQRQPIIKSGCSTIFPGISWYALAVGLLAFKGSSIPDYWGMPMLMTGIIIFVLSFIGVFMKYKFSIMSKDNYFIILIVLVSIIMQLILLMVRG